MNVRNLKTKMHITSYTSYYLFCPDHEPCANSVDNIYKFMEESQEGECICLYNRVRAPDLDADLEIRNRYAYVTILMENRGVFRREAFMAGLNMLKRYNLPYNFMRLCIPEEFKRAFQNLAFKFLEKIYAPDYVWKSKGGQRTIDVIKNEFEMLNG